MTEQSIGSDVFAVLGILVLEREAGGRFRTVGPAPAWFTNLRPGADAGPEALNRAVAFPFLENFLQDAEDFWTSTGAGRLKSGLWSETGAVGEEVHLEATAVCLGRRKILLLENQTLFHDEKQHMLQKARTSNLKRRERKRSEERWRR